MKGLLFTYLMTYGGSVVALFNPYVGVLIYVCFAILKPEALWAWSVSEGYYSKIIAISLLVGWILHGLGNWGLGRARAVVLSLIAYWLWSAVSASQAMDQSVAWNFVVETAKIVIPFVVGITTIDSTLKLKQLAWVIVLSQGFVAFEMNLSYYEGFNRVREIGFAGMEEGSISIGMVTCAGLALFLGLDAKPLWQKGLGLGLTLLLSHVPMLSMSRGGMLGLLVMGLTSFFLIPKRPTHYLMFGLAVLLCLRLAGTEVRTRFNTSFAHEGERDASAQSRLDLWNNCWDAMLKRPLLGIGPDHFPLIAAEYGWPAGKEAHTLWLQIGAELGFPGLIFLALFYGVSLKRLWPMTRERCPVADPWYRCGSRMVIASTVGFALPAQFISLEGLEVPFYVVLLGAGILKLASAPVAEEQAPAATAEADSDRQPALMTMS
jgi:putative inorganic carbon (HCO3(-)) transporter